MKPEILPIRYTPKKAFHSFVSEEMIHEILQQTNRKASDLRRLVPTVRGYMANFAYDEMCAGV